MHFGFIVLFYIWEPWDVCWFSSDFHKMSIANHLLTKWNWMLWLVKDLRKISGSSIFHLCSKQVKSRLAVIRQNCCCFWKVGGKLRSVFLNSLSHQMVQTIGSLFSFGVYSHLLWFSWIIQLNLSLNLQSNSAQATWWNNSEFCWCSIE